MSAQVAADLRAAAEVLRRDGWMQDDNGSCDGPKCLAGAVNYVVTGALSVDEFPEEDEEQEARADAAMRVVADLVGENYVFIARWNDAPGRTADEVIAALEAAADAAEQAAP
jgi:hypothetical protein